MCFLCIPLISSECILRETPFDCQVISLIPGLLLDYTTFAGSEEPPVGAITLEQYLDRMTGAQVLYTYLMRLGLSYALLCHVGIRLTVSIIRSCVFWLVLSGDQRCFQAHTAASGPLNDSIASLLMMILT